ncbi:hypothetical protein PGT21_016657 [Puccinia graminis f. sp. tritici]|uniref:Glutathione S-transferase n=1 Tax=Puccinia graminis f. sp. tritici TaxID=56615 RepID=A0A5B0R0U5_PUCGR|nr:hypothetical protein PGT21_016657 [Puccinia graminis f. sp. tritici]
MPSYKLTYFGFKGGRGESIRMALHCGGIPFTDERLTHEQFAKIKESLPFGQVPILTIDEKTVISQEAAILRYIGRKTGLYPEDPEEAVQVDVWMCFVDDLYSAVPPFFAPEHPGKEIMIKTTIEERIPKMLSYLEKHLSDSLNNKGLAFSAGSRLTVADLRIYAALTLYKSGMLSGLPTDLVESSYPNISKLYQAIENHEKVAQWKKAQA